MKIKYGLIIFLFCVACGGGGSKNGQDIENGFDPTLSESNLGICKERERLSGTSWYQPEITDGELTLTDVSLKFGYYGEFAMGIHGYSSDIYFSSKGEYQFKSADTLHLHYRTYARDGDDVIIAQEVLEEDAKFSIGDDGKLTIEIPGDPVYNLLPNRDYSESASFFRGESKYHSDGFCLQSEYPEIKWGEGNNCAEEMIWGNWDMVFPETVGSKSLQSLRLNQPQDSGPSSFTWSFVEHFDFAKSPFADSSIDDILSHPGSTSSDNEEYQDPRISTSKGSYLLLDEKTIQFTYDEDVTGLHKPGDIEKYSMEFGPEGFMHLQSEDGKEKLLAAEGEMDSAGPSRDLNDDGVCEGVPITSSCPAERIVGRWGLAPYFKEVYGEQEIPLTYNFSLVPFDWLTFYDNGTVRVYKDGTRIHTFNYQVHERECSGSCRYAQGDWDLQFTDPSNTDHYLFSINISDKALTLYREDYDYGTYSTLSDKIVLPLMNKGPLTQTVSCGPPLD